jgi:hypothetical protein
LDQLDQTSEISAGRARRVAKPDDFAAFASTVDTEQFRAALGRVAQAEQQAAKIAALDQQIAKAEEIAAAQGQAAADPGNRGRAGEIMTQLKLSERRHDLIVRRLSIFDHTVGNRFRATYAQPGISKRSQLAHCSNRLPDSTNVLSI